ncbi:MAG TPA: hypothetical protein VFI06_09105 [Chitinophagaceae bacterium]|nr:hypothetical protein [Chitinophagaceae bacterium]
MKKNCLIILALLSFSFIQAQDTDTLNNDGVIKLYQSGFSTDLIKAKINSSPAKFDVSVNGMMKLKENKIPDDLINMIVSNPNGNASKNAAVPASGVTATSNVTTGIFLVKSASETVEMNPSYIASKKTDRTAQFLVSGLIDADIRVVWNENKAATQVNNMPKFQFVFDTLKSNNDNAWFGKNSTPKNFFLVKLKPTKKTRELIIGTTSALQDQIEIKEKQKIPLKTKKIGPGVWEVSPVTPLEAGEYGFVFSNAIWDTQSGKIYDFSVK